MKLGRKQDYRGVSMARKIKYTKKGQPYVITRSGKAKFIKKTKTTRRKRKTTKTKRSRTMAKKKRSYRRSSSALGKLNKPIMGAAGVVAYESFLSPMIPLQGVAKDMLELVGGLYLSKKRGFLGATGKTLVTINSYQLISGMIGGKLRGLTGSNNEDGIYNYGGMV